MKKTIILITLLISSHTTTFSMELVRQLSPKRRRSQQPLLPTKRILKDALKETTTHNLLLLIHRAEQDHNITPLQLADYALTQEKHEDNHNRICIEMNRIAIYHATIAEKKKLCPAIHLHNNFDTIMSLYKEYREVRLRANQCGLPISESQQQHATPYPIEIAPNIAFEDYINLEIDLYELYINPADWHKIVTMLTTKLHNTPSPVSLINLDSEDEPKTK